MSLESNNINNNNSESFTNFNFNELFSRLLRRWPLIILSLIVFSLSAYLYLRTLMSEYETTALVLVKDTGSGSAHAELNLFDDLGIFKGNTNMYNEIEVLKSRVLLTEVVKKLRLNVTYTQLRSFFESNVEHYEYDTPLTIEYFQGDSALWEKKGSYKVEIENKDEFIISEEHPINKNWKKLGTFKFNEWIKSRIGTIRIKKTQFFHKDYVDATIEIKISTVKATSNRLKKKIKIEPVNGESTVLGLSTVGTIIDQNEHLLNALIDEHERQAVADKNQISRNTSDFINERMLIIANELTDVESEGESFKSQHQLIDVKSDAHLYLLKGGELENRLTALSIQMMLAEYLIDYLKSNNEPYATLPSNLGFEDNTINQMTSEYNTLVLERNKTIESSNLNHPAVLRIQSQLLSLRSSLMQSLMNLKGRLNIELTATEKKDAANKSRIGNIPEYERRYREISRQQQIKETLYLYLLQKREENEIAMASAVGTIKILDSAFTDSKPVSPNKYLILVSGVLFGLFLPFSIIFIQYSLDNKIRKKEDLEKLGIPIIGEIPRNNTEDYLVVKQGDRSLIAEAFRMLRTNLNFYLTKQEGIGKTIFITSTIAGEGKTFNSMNIAASLALSGKKTVLLGMDLRAPKLKKFLSIGDGPGVTNYLIDESLSVEDIIVKYDEVENFYIVHSGIIPPNPAELLLGERVNSMFSYLKEHFDYVVVDNSPISLVTDGLAIAHHADLFLYVVRANYLIKDYLDIPKSLVQNEQIKSMAFILNDTAYGFGGYRGYGYGYGHGYGYGSTYGTVYGETPKKKFSLLNIFRKK